MLTGMFAPLNQFISKLANWCRPFYQLLKKWRGFQWTEECEEAFQDLKRYLVSTPVLSSPKVGEDLYMYVAIFEHAVSSVLLRDQATFKLTLFMC